MSSTTACSGCDRAPSKRSWLNNDSSHSISVDNSHAWQVATTAENSRESPQRSVTSMRSGPSRRIAATPARGAPLCSDDRLVPTGQCAMRWGVADHHKQEPVLPHRQSTAGRCRSWSRRRAGSPASSCRSPNPTRLSESDLPEQLSMPKRRVTELFRRREEVVEAAVVPLSDEFVPHRFQRRGVASADRILQRRESRDAFERRIPGVGDLLVDRR